MSDLERRRAEERAFQLAAIVDSCPDAIIGMTLEGTITSWNRGGQTIYGYSPEEAIGRPLAMLAPSDRPREIPQILARVARGEVVEQHETIRIRKDGTPVDVSVTASPIRDSAGRVVSGCVVARDIRERKRFERQLQHLADHDALTGLFNRRRFIAELQRHVDYNARYGGQAAILLVDLDHFKHINDTLGHAAGDAVIARIGGVLRRALRRTDVIARLGGDEFAVLLPRAGADQAANVAEALLAQIRRTMHLGDTDHPVHLTASIGISLVGQDAERSGEAALVNADFAMYQAKHHGRDRAEGAGAPAHAAGTRGPRFR